jgi:hypothetical protein
LTQTEEIRLLPLKIKICEFLRYKCCRCGLCFPAGELAVRSSSGEPKAGFEQYLAYHRKVWKSLTARDGGGGGFSLWCRGCGSRWSKSSRDSEMKRVALSACRSVLVDLEDVKPEEWVKCAGSWKRQLTMAVEVLTAAVNVPPPLREDLPLPTGRTMTDAEIVARLAKLLPDAPLEEEVILLPSLEECERDVVDWETPGEEEEVEPEPEPEKDGVVWG